MKTLTRERFHFLDFKEYRASKGRHSIHDYPAMLHYLLVRFFIKNLTNHDSIIYDPFCGSGVSIVEGLKQKRKIFGTDINPLALLIADVRASDFDINIIDEYLKRLKNEWNKLTSEIPSVKNIDYWFKDYVIKDLGRIRRFLKKIDDEKISKFFLVVFSQTVRDVSNNRKGEFKRYRIEKSKLKNFCPNVKETFLKMLTAS
ncbi:MAG: site-specific DNA-methyltransferase [Aquificae bacterium]|nr:site-specific DNA-methyltransferase [Aquificota bacterium]